MNNQNDILVSICCITYNQVPYIRQCLDGFLMQKTNFKVEILIHDDCSTDGTTEIVREYAEKYPDIIVPIIQSVNQYQQGNKRILASFVYPKVKGKYLALCEGDDYWIDPLKLQKQVDFIESHPETGLVRTDVNRYFNDSKSFEYDFFKNKMRHVKTGLEDLILNSWFLAPCSWLYRSEFLMQFPELDCQKYFTGDTLITLYIAANSHISFLSDTTAVYRVLKSSASHFQDFDSSHAFWYSNLNTRLYFAKEKSWRFKLKFLWKIARKEHPAFQGKPSRYYIWIHDVIHTVLYLFMPCFFERNVLMRSKK